MWRRMTRYRYTGVHPRLHKFKKMRALWESGAQTDICSGAQIRYICRMRLQILLSCNQSVSPSSVNCKSRLLISFPSINSVPDISKKFCLNAFFISKTQIPFLLKEDYALWEMPANKLLLHFFSLSSWYLNLLLCSKRKHNKRKKKKIGLGNKTAYWQSTLTLKTVHGSHVGRFYCCCRNKRTKAKNSSMCKWNDLPSNSNNQTVERVTLILWAGGLGVSHLHLNPNQ